MNCRRVDYPDCPHISQIDNHWFCDIREARITNPDLDGCLYCELHTKNDILVEWDQALQDFRGTINEFVDEWHLSVMRAIRKGTIIINTIIAIAIAIAILTWSLI